MNATSQVMHHPLALPRHAYIRTNMKLCRKKTHSLARTHSYIHTLTHSHTYPMAMTRSNPAVVALVVTSVGEAMRGPPITLGWPMLDAYHAYKHTQMHMLKKTCRHKRRQTYVFTQHINLSMHTQTFIHAHTYAPKYTDVYTHMEIDKHTYTCTHTHSLTHSLTHTHTHSRFVETNCRPL